MSLFRAFRRPQVPPVAPRPEMPTGPQRQPLRDERPRLQRPAFPFPPDQGYMTGGVNPDFDPCDAGPIKASAGSKSGEKS